MSIRVYTVVCAFQIFTKYSLFELNSLDFGNLSLDIQLLINHRVNLLLADFVFLSL